VRSQFGVIPKVDRKMVCFSSELASRPTEVTLCGSLAIHASSKSSTRHLREEKTRLARTSIGSMKTNRSVFKRVAHEDGMECEQLLAKHVQVSGDRSTNMKDSSTPKSHRDDSRPKVAVIGGGVSGLGVAYNLLKKVGSSRVNIQIFEKEAHLGGNCFTVNSSIGGSLTHLDVGVSDFNMNKYPLLSEVFEELNVNTADISNLITWHGIDGKVMFTSKRLMSDPALGEMGKQARRYMKEVTADGLYNSRYVDYTLGEYVKEKGYTKEFIHKFLHPVAKSCFFGDGTTLNEMPLACMAKFHEIQHGYRAGDLPNPRRRYFKGGAAAWITKLASKIEEMTADEKRGPFRLEARCQIRKDSQSGSGWLLYDGQKSEHFDHIVFCIQANGIVDLFVGGPPPMVRDLVGRIRYSSCKAVVHTTFGINHEETAAFNIFERDYEKPQDLWKYRIMYNVNCHQGNSGNWAFLDQDGDKHEVMVHINPDEDIVPEEAILRYVDGTPIELSFSHHVFDKELLKSQRKVLPKVQGVGGLYFAAHWTNGVGVHECCWEASVQVAHLLAQRLNTITYAANHDEHNCGHDGQPEMCTFRDAGALLLKCAFSAV